MKKAILVLFCSIFTASIVFAAGEQDAAGSKDPNYPIKISVFTSEPQQQPPASNKTYKWMKERFNVEFEWDILVGDLDQKIGVMIASGDYPDLLHISSPKFIEAGAVIPLEDLIEAHGPNLKKAYGHVWDQLKEEDGHIYCLPNWGVINGRYQSQWYGDSALWIQKAVLKEFNYPKITTVDEYFDILEKYKKKYPTIDGMPTIAYTILTYDWRAFCLINPPNFLAGFPNDGNGTISKNPAMPHGYEYKVFLGQDISKQWFKKLNEVNQRGLIDRSCFTENFDQYLAKLATGRVLGLHDQYWQFQSAMQTLGADGKYWRQMAPLPIVFDKSIKPWYRNRPLPNLQRGFGISVKAKDPVRIIRFMNAQMEEDAQRILQWGFEGEDWFWDEDGAPSRTEEMRDDQADPIWKLENKAQLWFETAPKLIGSFSDGWATDIGETPKEYALNAKEEDKEVWKAYNVASYAELMDMDPPDNPVWFPMWQIEPPAGSPAQIGWQKANDEFRKHLPRIILAEPKDFERLWNDYLKALDAAGVKDYEKFMQENLDKRLAKAGK